MRAVRAQLAYAVMVTEEKTKIYNELAEQAAERAAAREQAQAEKDEMQAKIDAYIAEHGGKDARCGGYRPKILGQLAVAVGGTADGIECGKREDAAENQESLHGLGFDFQIVPA